jgi:exodeoxyribonuclease V alpha subunit
MDGRMNAENASGPTAATEEMAGVVEGLVYHNETSGYTVCSVAVHGKREPVTVVGLCPSIWTGENIRACGRWVRHKRHGLQFQADAITCIVPSSVKGIERYLASGVIRGIGKVNAARLVKAFGDATLEIIEKESKRLEEVEGIGPQRRRMIKESWQEQKAVRDIMIFLQGHGIGTAQSGRIYRQYGHHAIAMISADPYRLCREIWGIGFKTADRVAMSMGIQSHSPLRARAGLVYTLQSLAEAGHCFCPEPLLLLEAQKLLEIPVEILAAALAHELETGSLVRDGEHVYIAALYEAEVHIAERVLRIAKAPAGFPPIETQKAVPWAEARMEMTFAPRQVEALTLSLASKVSIMTGGPGVGKTTLIRALVDVFLRRKLSVTLAAPTGRAAKRMEEATGHPAGTIHRLLKYQPRTGKFEHDRDLPLEGAVFILDEVSMIDQLLMSAFLDALPDDSHLILVGDIDQLPSVGPGNVLRDLIDSGTVPSIALDRVFRQESGGWIVRNAHRVNRGEPLTLAEGEEDSDFYFVERQEPEQVVALLRELIVDRIPERFGFDPMSDIQVLTPMRRFLLGSDNLNMLLQEWLNPTGPHVERFGRAYRVNDRIMQIRNNYDKEVFNGDIGRIVALNEEDRKVVADIDGRSIAYDFNEMDELVHAYACTIHKSQGCEYPAVIVLLTTQHYRMLQRNLLYTALTRGKKLVCLLGSRKAVHMAIRNNEIGLRRTGLRQRLIGERS